MTFDGYQKSSVVSATIHVSFISTLSPWFPAAEIVWKLTPGIVSFGSIINASGCDQWMIVPTIFSLFTLNMLLIEVFVVVANG